VTDLQERLVQAALQFGSFTLRSGVQTDRYFDKYRITTVPDLLSETCAALADMIYAIQPEVDGIVVPALGAVPLGAGVSLITRLPFAIVRDQAKQYGTGHGIEGTLVTDGPVVLIEDVVTSGGAAVEAARAATDAGAQIAAALCVLDRESGGAQALGEIGITLQSLLQADAISSAQRPARIEQ
jgi:orotate phosphoribosyltransferase